MLNVNEFEIYVHIPFCVKKCLYCDFLSAPADESTKDDYIDAVIKSIMGFERDFSKKKVRSIYFGGGTPSVVKPEGIVGILNAIRNKYDVKEDAEITIEVNPGTVDINKLLKYKEAGINRLSIGLQSSNDVLLKRLGRIHTYDDFLRTYSDAVSVGITNISVDVMSSLPGQTIDEYRDTLLKVIALKPTHISSYSLIVEEGTPFEKMYESGEYTYTDEEIDRCMYEMTKEILKESGYERYEISNYALKGFESRHNSGYWEGYEYIGFGLGAASFIDNVRYKNTSGLKKYLLNPCGNMGEVERLLKKDRMAEFVFLGMRMTKGISKTEFMERFNEDIFSVYGKELEKHINEALIKDDGNRLYLSEEGLSLSNYVFGDFV